MSKKKPEESMPPPPGPEEDGPPPGPPEDDSPPLEDSEDDEDMGHRQSVMDDDESFSGPPPLAEDPREKKVEPVPQPVAQQQQPQQQQQQAQTAKPKERVSVAPKGDKKLPHEKSKGGPPPQVVRVVMTDSNAQFITLRCEPTFTVEEFSQILAKKLSLKGKGQVDSSHFSLCLLDPRATRDPKRLQPTQNVLGAFKDQLLAAAGRYVLHLVPGSNISAGVNKTIRASFAVSPSTKSGKSPLSGGGMGGISEGLPTTKTGVTTAGIISKSPAGKPTKEQLKEEELRKMNEDLKAKLAATEKQLKQQESQLAVTNTPQQQKRPSKGDTLSTPEISSKTISPRNSKDKMSSDQSPKPSPKAGTTGPFDKKQDPKSPQAQSSQQQSRISEKKNVKQIIQQQDDEDDDETSPPPAPEDDEEQQPSAPPQKVVQTPKPTTKSTPTPTPTIPAPTPKSTPTPTPTTTTTTPVKKKPIILMEETLQPVLLEEKEDLDLSDPSTYPPPPPSPKDIGGDDDEENTPKQKQPQQQPQQRGGGVSQQSGAKSPVNSQTLVKKPPPTKAPAPPPPSSSSSNKGPSKPAPTKAPAPPPPSDDAGSDSDSDDDDDDDDL